MISTARPKRKDRIDDPLHHLAGPFVPPSPTPPALPSPPAASDAKGSGGGGGGMNGKSPKPTSSPVPRPEDVSLWLRWAVSPTHALALLALPPLLAVPAQLLLPLLPAALRPARNPLLSFFLLSHPAPPPARAEASAYFPFPRPSASSPTGSTGPQLYIKGPGDLALLAWSVVFFSLLRLLLTHYAFPAFARRWGITKEGKLLRFGEQGYAVCYWAIFGAWGVYNMSTTRAFWFRTSFLWADYPHTHLSASMKRYYLSQIAYWLQQALVLTLGLEKRRSDFWEYVLHHLITVWMVSWSYLMNVTLLGTAVFVSMDIPDTGLAFSKLLNYLQFERAKVVSLGMFTLVWTYFRHYISIRILWSLQYEFDLVPKYAQIFSPTKGLYMAHWMRDQMFYTLCILQGLNLFWFYLILRIIVRSIMTSQTDDNRSDEEEEEEVPVVEEKMEQAEVEEKGLPPSIGARDKKSSGGRSKKGKGAAARTGAGGGLTAAPNAPAE